MTINAHIDTVCKNTVFLVTSLVSLIKAFYLHSLNPAIFIRKVFTVIVKMETPPRKEYQFSKGMKVSKLLKELQLNPESVIVICKNELLSSEDWINQDDEVSIRSVVSGG